MSGRTTPSTTNPEPTSQGGERLGKRDSGLSFSLSKNVFSFPAPDGLGIQPHVESPQPFGFGGYHAFDKAVDAVKIVRQLHQRVQRPCSKTASSEPICIFLYVYIYIYIYIYIHTYMYMYVCIYMYIYVSMYLCIYIYLSIYQSIYLYIAIDRDCICHRSCTNLQWHQHPIRTPPYRGTWLMRNRPPP